MGMKISIQLSCPIRFEKIRNGEKIIVQTGPDEYEVDIQESAGNEPSTLIELHKLLDEGKKQVRKERRHARKCGTSSNPVVPLRRRGKNPTDGLLKICEQMYVGNKV